MDTTPTTPLAPRRRWLAVLLSCCGSGIGHVYAGQARKGILLFTLELLPVPLIIGLAFLPPSGLVLGVLLGLVLFLVGLYTYALWSAARAADGATTSVVGGPFQRSGLYLLMAFVSVGWAAGGMFLVREHAFEAFVVPTASMAPAIKPGDRILVNKMRDSDLEKGDIVVFKSPENPDQMWVKRVHALPGEKPDGSTLRPGWIYVLGDNRENSRDSRHFGPIRVEWVVGTAEYACWSTDGIKTLKGKH